MMIARIIERVDMRANRKTHILLDPFYGKSAETENERPAENGYYARGVLNFPLLWRMTIS